MTADTASHFFCPVWINLTLCDAALFNLSQWECLIPFECWAFEGFVFSDLVKFIFKMSSALSIPVQNNRLCQHRATVPGYFTTNTLSPPAGSSLLYESLWHINGLRLCTFFWGWLDFFPHMLCNTIIFKKKFFIEMVQPIPLILSVMLFMWENYSGAQDVSMKLFFVFFFHLCSWYLSNTEPADSF